jgi:hypothetical protein
MNRLGTYRSPRNWPPRSSSLNMSSIAALKMHVDDVDRRQVDFKYVIHSSLTNFHLWSFDVKKCTYHPNLGTINTCGRLGVT